MFSDRISKSACHECMILFRESQGRDGGRLRSLSGQESLGGPRTPCQPRALNRPERGAQGEPVARGSKKVVAGETSRRGITCATATWPASRRPRGRRPAGVLDPIASDYSSHLHSSATLILIFLIIMSFSAGLYLPGRQPWGRRPARGDPRGRQPSRVLRPPPGPPQTGRTGTGGAGRPVRDLWQRRS